MQKATKSKQIQKDSDVRKAEAATNKEHAPMQNTHTGRSEKQGTNQRSDIQRAIGRIPNSKYRHETNQSIGMYETAAKLRQADMTFNEHMGKSQKQRTQSELEEPSSSS